MKPKTIEAAIAELKKRLGKNGCLCLKRMKKRELIKLHFDFGMYIRNNLGLWGNNKSLLNATGKEHPDDASMVIIQKLWANLQKS